MMCVDFDWARQNLNCSTEVKHWCYVEGCSISFPEKESPGLITLCGDTVVARESYDAQINDMPSVCPVLIRYWIFNLDENSKIFQEKSENLVQW